MIDNKLKFFNYKQVVTGKKQTLEQMNLENKGYRGSAPIRIIQGRNPTWHTRLSFPKYRGNFEPPRENSAAARKRKGALPFGKRRVASGRFCRERALKTAPGKFSHLSAVPIPANTKRTLPLPLPFLLQRLNAAHRKAENIRPSFNSLRPARYTPVERAG